MACMRLMDKFWAALIVSPYFAVFCFWDEAAALVCGSSSLVHPVENLLRARCWP